MWFTLGMNTRTDVVDKPFAEDLGIEVEKPPPSRSRHSVAVIFFTNGFVFASWVPHIPAVKDRHALSDAMLGGVLLAMAVGALLALPVAGGLVGRFGSRLVTRVAAIGFCLALPLPVMSPSVMPLLASLVLFGALNATLDVAMNAQAVEIEKRYARAIMSSFHGLFSLGGLVGAATAGLSFAAGLSDAQHVIVVAACFVVLVIAMLPALMPVGSLGSSSNPVFVKPTGVLLGLGVLAFFGLLVEGAMADWSAVYLRDSLGATPALASAGFAAFSLTMAAGRFTGDRLVSKMGPENLMRLSGWIAAVGLSGAVVLRDPWVAIVGFGLVGLGASNIIPILFSAAGRVPGASTGTALAAVATTGYLGFLAGPPLIGFVAELSSMSMALGMVALFCAVMALRASALPRP